MPRAKRRRDQEPAPSENQDASQERSARAFWSGTISFGLVSVPVDLYPAQRSSRTSLRMLAPDGTPLSRRYFAEGRESELTSEAIERGYQLDDGSVVVVTDEELDALAPEQSRDIDLRRFVDRDEIAPIYVERAYFLLPSSGSTLAYRLLAATMEHLGKAGIATFVMRGKQYTVAIVAENGILRAETLRFAEEIRTPEEVGLPEPVVPDGALVARMQSAMEALSTDTFPRELLRNTSDERLRTLAERKREAQRDVVTPEQAEAEVQGANVVDLFAALKRSLQQNQEQEHEAAPPRREARPTRRPGGPKPVRATRAEARPNQTRKSKRPATRARG